jgi:uncharacterized membrane protein
MQMVSCHPYLLRAACALALSLLEHAAFAGALNMDHSPTFSEPTSAVILDLGQLSGGAHSSYAAAISADGRLVVGSANHGNYGQVAFSWMPATGMVSLDQSFLVRHSAYATAVAADGSVVVGAWVMSNGLDRAFRWTKQGGMVTLAVLPGSDRSAAEAVSADGRVVVGTSGGAFRWTESTGMVALPGRSMFGAKAVTADGRMVYGDEMGGDDIHVVRWDEDGTITQYPNPPGVTAAFPAAVTPDGSVLVGQQHTQTPDSRSPRVEAVLWYSPTERVPLGFLHGGNYSKAMAVNTDGTVIIGVASDGSKNNTGTAFRWTPTTGMQSLAEWVVSAGGSAPASIPIEANGVSGDGSRVVGALRNGDPFVAVVPNKPFHTPQTENKTATLAHNAAMPVNRAELDDRRQFSQGSAEGTPPPTVPSERANRSNIVAAPASFDGVPPIRFGDTVEVVQHSLDTSVQAQPGSGLPPDRQQGNITQLHLESKGLWVFFTEGKVYELRFDPPFSGAIGGIRLGDSANRIEELLGRPAGPDNWGNLKGYRYYLDDKTMVRFMTDSGGTVRTIFLIATQRH